MNSFKIQVVLSVVVVLATLWMCTGSEAKLLRRSRYYDEGGFGSSGFDGPYGGGSMGAMPTGERAIITVRGARNPYDGSAPSKIAIEDNPYRGAYPRGIYDRLDGYGGGAGRMGSLYPRRDPYNSYDRYSGYGPSMFGGAPDRIAVTGAFPYGYGRRF